MTAPILIRPATRDDAAAMAAIEVAAAQRFREIGMTHIAEAEPTDTAAVLVRIDGGRAYVAVDAHGACVGFAFYRLLDAQRLYLEELDVAPSHAGQRIGARLIEQVMARAAQDGIAEVVLSTFREAPWNAPYYARLGFEVLDDAMLDDMLRTIRAYHVSLGLDETQRVFMRLRVSG
ncbi:TPA: GNAT family N-acetyltransferase [Burkholderia aenigmatica]|uniref:GNAT family N-acetyltransferase n=1 Tax=Burkholderia sp. AU45251 TaxID=3059204 RepID=UPI002655B40E|nr:GNAT family N-acetyltransferase [Burkholderia sp. AU45251]HDR9480917.1 GNAT family N-acetyltransferase [Burkholderia aenigmatica]MDN7514470.1 GNAT family N-acetyltransferase [Burkholderia sp. AU45251]HDR9517560.1 GNAT family N-acetyltransferase [Burkholderia aenigmatica]HDR9594427.1 GNAT family N-acetyltransferase [Burkholderia aenigmatica]HDR9603434.1 GNAT family N-acetyltransferase [Burkholderia aenigmatica]